MSQTDIWYVTFRTNQSFISTYYFTENDFFENDWIKRSEQYRLDPYNENTFGEGANKASVLNIGMEVQYSSRFPSNHYPSGRIETYSFHSSVLNNTRNIHIYTPHDYSHTSHLQKLLIVFDGNSFINDLSIAKTLNYLIYEKEIPSCIAVAIEPVDRLEELTYNDKMNLFLTEELLPWIQTKVSCASKSEPYNNCWIQSWWLSSFLCSASKSTCFRKRVINVWIRALEKGWL